jgi:hypothetical protein
MRYCEITKTDENIIFSSAGDCVDGSCVCVEGELDPDHSKCIDDSFCNMYCQVTKKAKSGKCEGQHGWDCICIDSDYQNQLDGGLD